MKNSFDNNAGASRKYFPLSGKRVLVTRAHGQSLEFLEQLKGLGAEAIAFPLIEITEPYSWKSVDGSLEKISSYDSLIFTSANGVKFFFRRFFEHAYELVQLKETKIYAVGPATAHEIIRLGLKVELVPEEFRAEGLLKVLDESWITGRRFLLARAMIAREIITETIASRGGYVDVAIAYRTVKCSSDTSLLRELFLSGRVDVVTFTSPSAVKSFAVNMRRDDLSLLLEKCKIACIGPLTAEAAQKSGFRVDIVPREYSIPALAKAIAWYFESEVV